MATELAKAIYRFEAAQPGDLSFRVGDVIVVLQKNNTGWWLGRTQDGRQGIFPYNRVKVIEQQSAVTTPLASPAKSPAAPAQFIQDRVNKVNVRRSQAPPAPNQPMSYPIEVVVSNGTNVTGEKSLDDFRILNHVFNMLTSSSGAGGFRKTDKEHYEVPIPEWSDNIPLDKSQSSKRANQLEEYLESALGDTEMEYAIVYWINPSAAFSLSDAKKSSVQQITQTAISQNSNVGNKALPLLVRAAYNWTQRDEQEINLLKGEVVAVLEKNTMFNGWWLGQKYNGKTGVFPYNYVQELPRHTAEKLVNPFSSNSPAAPEQIPATPMSPLSPKFAFPGNEGKNPEYQFEVQTGRAFSPPSARIEGRNRRRVTKYALCATEAFDELLQNGVTIEENGKLAKFAGRNNTPKRGDTVILFYSGYIWEPQKQELLEFASSDVLIGAKGGKDRTKAGPLEFTIGAEQAIEGVEDAVSRMEIGQTVRVTLTPDKGYGDVGYPPDIPGNAYLVYDLTLQECKRNAASMKPNQAGAERSNVANRKLDGQMKDFKGYKSMQEMRNVSQKQVEMQSKRRIQNLAGPSAVATDGAVVDSDAFKKKLTLLQLQEIVRKKQFGEYGIIPGIIEEYMTEEEFTKAFNVDHYTWLLMPAFKRKQLKQQLQLF